MRDDEIEHGYFELDPCNLRAGEAEEVAQRLIDALSRLHGTRRSGISFQEWCKLAGRLA